ncbi:DUF935 domain-containing protein [Denitromonas halophila]|uniref:DUF935 domain-containing protein n=1 Tax=Denitromonas halophila TaxID=1629404 RepID=A0A557QXC8_9RHOO|nr:DUF935 domain-containing protein [Denitromonas halophila]TVO57539.1 DUF935 domain-containing protein [Denitromonas halophila]
MTTILDQHGNPINRAILSEPQTARVAALQNEILQSHMDGITPARAVRILREADQGDIMAQHQLFDDMLDRDAHMQCEFGKRAGAVVGLDWSIEPPANASAREKKLAAWVEEILRDVVDDLEDVIMAMMDGVGHGFAPIELEWRRHGAEWLPAFHPRPQTWFRTSTDRRELRLRDNSPDGALLNPMGWIMHQPGKVKTGYLSRAGILRVLIWPFIYKAYSIGDFAEFLETWGLPIIIGKYGQASNNAEKASLLRAVTALGHDARAIMPEQMQIEISKITGTGSGTPHLSMSAWADSAESKAILGQVLSSEAHATGMGSGVADLHREVRQDILAADARQIAGTLTRDLVYPLIALSQTGVDSLRRCPRWVFDLGESEDVAAYAEALPKLVGVGMKIPATWAHEKLRIPLPDGTEEVLATAAPSAPPKVEPAPTGQATPPDAVPAALRATLPAQEPSPARYADAAADRLAQDAAAPLGEWLTAIAALVAEAGSLEDVRDRLLDAYGSLPASELQRVMAAGMATAELAGRFDVSNGE